MWLDKLNYDKKIHNLKKKKNENNTILTKSLK